MFDKKRALICSVILYALGAGGLVAYIVTSVGGAGGRITGLLLTMFIMFLCAAAAMTCVFFRLRRREGERDRRRQERRALRDGELKKWLAEFEPYAKPAKKLVETKEKTFSKLGGLPDVPSGFEWPTSGEAPLPFLLQIDFAEINADGALADFPQSGVLYAFVDGEEVDDPSFVDGEEIYEEGRTFKLLYFDGASGFARAPCPDGLKTVYREFGVKPETIKTYPDTDDCAAAFDLYCNAPVGGMDDEYDELQGENIDSSLIGGWATYIQGSDILPELGDGLLLMQITSYFDGGREPYDGDINWGDGGNIYMFIGREDLLARRFDRVVLDMQCF